MYALKPVLLTQHACRPING